MVAPNCGSLRVVLMDLEIFRVAVRGSFKRKELEKVQEDVRKLSCLKSTPLHYAVLGGNIKIVRFLLAQGAVVDAENVFKESPLHWACKLGKEEVILCLLSHQASPNVQDSEGNTPMHWAAEYDHEHVVRLLNLNGGRPSRTTRNEDRHTPLEVARLHSSRSVITGLRNVYQ